MKKLLDVRFKTDSPRRPIVPLGLSFASRLARLCKIRQLRAEIRNRLTARREFELLGLCPARPTRITLFTDADICTPSLVEFPPKGRVSTASVQFRWPCSQAWRAPTNPTSGFAVSGVNTFKEVIPLILTYLLGIWSLRDAQQEDMDFAIDGQTAACSQFYLWRRGHRRAS